MCLFGPYVPWFGDRFKAGKKYPADEHSWRVRIRNDDSAAYGVVAYAMCN